MIRAFSDDLRGRVLVASGPSRLLLGQLLANSGIETVLLDRASKNHILARVRAGVLEEAPSVKG